MTGKILWESPISFQADTNVTVEACSWEYYEPNNNQTYALSHESNRGSNNEPNNEPVQILTVNTSTSPSNLTVLTNGDAVPNIHGFQGQDSIEDFVKDYIENGSLNLKENEAIYIFELGNKILKTNGADFQDLVLLVSLNGADSSKSIVESQDADSSETPGETQDKTQDKTPDETQDKTPDETPNEMVFKLVIEHLGGDTINFKSSE